MPSIQFGNLQTTTSATVRNNVNTIGRIYEYPEGLDLFPESPDHQALLGRLLAMLQSSANIMSRRHSTWRDMDQNLTSYIPLSDYESLLKGDDPTRPVSFVVPMSYATLDTLLTYLSAAFLQEPIFRFRPRAPEDKVKALLLERVVAYQALRSKFGLALYNQWRDGLVYGFGAVHVDWDRKMRTVRGEVTDTPRQELLFEGNRITNLNPYNYMPDFTVPVYKVQDSMFVGWLERTTYISLLKRESSGTLFNVKYLSGVAGYSNLFSDDGKNKKTGIGDERAQYGAQPMDVAWMYVDLIPKDWELGNSDMPEKWVFGVAADTIIVHAAPTRLNHDMFPVSVCAPDYDGYAISPVSLIERESGMQTFASFMMNSRVRNIRKVLNNMFVVDTRIANLNDFRKSEAGLLIRLNLAASGMGLVDKAIHQLRIDDVTRQNIVDLEFILDLSNRMLGLADPLRGVVRATGDRVSATEVDASVRGALSRLEKTAKLISMQTMQDIGILLGEHTRQFMSNDTWVNVLGDVDSALAEFARDNMVLARPEEIDVSFDIIPSDGTLPSGNNTNQFLQLFQIIASQPDLRTEFDLKRMLLSLARRFGENNPAEFLRRDVNVDVQPTQQVADQLQNGNLVPTNDVLSDEDIIASLAQET